MPPKKKGGKKKKKSKEELEAERIAREEEEARLKAEEDARIAAEKAAAEEAERIRLAELARLRAEELARLLKEREDDGHDEAVRGNRLKKQEAELAKDADWAKFLACSPKPDPSVEAEINTYITETRARQEQVLDDAGRTCQYTEEIVRELDLELARAREANDGARVRRYLDYRRRLRDIEVDKLDFATAHVLEYADEHAEPKAQEVMMQRAFGNMSFGMWVNLGGRALRMKSLSFADIGIQVDVPKPVVSGGIAFRALWHECDNAQQRSKAVAAKSQSLSDEAEGIDRVGLSGGNLRPPTGGPAGGDRAGVAGMSTSRPSSATAARGASGAGGDAAEGATEGKGSETAGEGGEGKDAAGGGEGKEGGAADEEAAPTVRTHGGPTPEEEAADAIQFMNEDLGTSATTSRDVPLGGVIYVEMLQVPERSKQVKAWTLRQVSALTSTVKRLPHPMQDQVGAAGAAQALKVRFTMPRNVIMPAAPEEGEEGEEGKGDDAAGAAEGAGPPIRVAHWDGLANQWSEEGITEAEYNPDTRLVTFHTCRLMGMAVVQPRHMHLPFSSWSLEPTSETASVLRLGTPRFNVAIEVQGGSVRLLEPRIPELDDMLGLPMSPAQLLQATAACGLIIDPIEEDADYVTCEFTGRNIITKERRFERQVYADVSTLCAAFSLKWSKWNQTQSRTQAVLYMRETLDYDEEPDDVDETDWRCLKYERDDETADGLKVSIIKAKDSVAEFNDERAEMEVTHRRAGIPIAARSTPEAMELAADSSPLYQKTVAQMLMLVRPLSFN